MEQEKTSKKWIRQSMEGRAARVCAVAVTVFLCILTFLEITALELEWEIPVLEIVGGEKSFTFWDYQKEEEALDESTENILLEERHEVDVSGDTDKSLAKDQPFTGKDDTLESGKLKKNVVDTEDAGKNQTEQDEKLVAAIEPEFPYYIKVNRKQNCITIFIMDESGKYTVPYKAMICSTGLYNATPRGTFRLSTKYLWRELYGGVYGQYATRIHGGVLFHSVPYYRKAKNALCTEKYNKLGQQASMGCIRLTVEDAKWIAENCPAGTTVEIYEDEDPGPLGKPEAIKIDGDNPNKGWDPTDPDEENPWKDISRDE